MAHGFWRGIVALLCLGYDPTITNSVWLVKVAIRSRRQSIWVTYTSRRYTAFYTGFRCMLQLYIDLASSRLACRDIQRIQRIQPIQLYSYTRYTAYSTIQPPSGESSQTITLVRLPARVSLSGCRLEAQAGRPNRGVYSVNRVACGFVDRSLGKDVADVALRRVFRNKSLSRSAGLADYRPLLPVHR